MKFKSIALGSACLAAGLFSSGCGKSQSDAPTQSSSGSVAANQPQSQPKDDSLPTGSGGPSEGSKNPPGPANADGSKPAPDSASESEREIAKKIEEKAKSIQSPFASNRTAAEGWRKSAIKPAELGKKVDQAMAGLKGVYGEASLYVKNKELEGNNSANFKIKDKSTYSIQYQLPGTPTELNRLVADGKQKVLWEHGKWLPQQSEDPSITAFQGSFPKKIFSPLTSNSPEWSRLLSDLAGGKSGYTSVIEEKQMSANGRTFNYIRIVAKKGKEATIEARFDAKRLVPLTIRITQKDKNGFESQYQWQAKWSFDNQFPETDFQIAKNPS